MIFTMTAEISSLTFHSSYWGDGDDPRRVTSDGRSPSRTYYNRKRSEKTTRNDQIRPGNEQKRPGNDQKRPRNRCYCSIGPHCFGSTHDSNIILNTSPALTIIPFLTLPLVGEMPLWYWEQTPHWCWDQMPLWSWEQLPSWQGVRVRESLNWFLDPNFRTFMVSQNNPWIFTLNQIVCEPWIVSDCTHYSVD